MTTCALVVRPKVASSKASARAEEARLEEAVGLAQAIELDVRSAECLTLTRPNPARLIGQGALERFAAMVETDSIDVVVVDADLTPIQQRNLERRLSAKVIDRTGLILEIFGARARTKEGQLQVELAALSYQRSRLVRSWTHLERQRGGFGFLGGPGESQLEIDRRLITERITRLKKDLAGVTRTRAIQRASRRRVPFPIVALVGYTNAGKSTLFNRLTDAEVTAQDQLFATLDPTLRQLRLPSGRNIIVSDTVGFISDLPTELIAAFRATLEEVIEADILIHVRDVSNAENAAQKKDVEEILATLGWEVEDNEQVIEALNKADLLDDETRQILAGQAARQSATVLCSAKSGEGFRELLALLDRKIETDHKLARYLLPLSDGASIAWLYQNGRVVEQQDEDLDTLITVMLPPADAARFEHRLRRGVKKKKNARQSREKV